MGPGMFDGLDVLLKTAFWTLVIAVPLALWKVGELVWWLFHHVSIR